jgi:hypothetical protein
MQAVRLRDPLDEVLVVRAFGAPASERALALPRAEARFRFRARWGDALDASTLAELYALAFDHVVSTPAMGAAREVIARRVEEAVDSGRLLVIARPRRTVLSPIEAVEEPPLGPANEPTSWIEIELHDDAGQPMSGELYELVTGDGRSRTGWLDERGLAREEGIDPGDCKVTFPRLHAWRPA